MSLTKTEAAESLQHQINAYNNSVYEDRQRIEQSYTAYQLWARTSRNRTVLGELTFVQLVKHFPHFLQPAGPFLC